MTESNHVSSRMTAVAVTATRSDSLGSLPDHFEADARLLANEEQPCPAPVTLIAKFGKQQLTLQCSTDTTIGQVKEELYQCTRVLPKRQKLIGLVAKQGGIKGVTDELPLSELQSKKASATGSQNQQFSFILMGTPEEEIFIDRIDNMDDNAVVDDFDLDFTAGSNEWYEHVAKEENLKKFTQQTVIHIMNAPRQGKPLLVLDLDHTLLDFSSRILLASPESSAMAEPSDPTAAMKRPHMDAFLTSCYQHYDLVVWSQTSWRWLETKLIELGMLTHPGYRFCFVLDKTSMFTITSTRRRDGTSVTHHVKPLQLIWSKFPHQWGSHNTVHVDDLSRNFALNMHNGLKIKAYYRKKSSKKKDVELLGMARYLEELALSRVKFDEVDFEEWVDVVSGKLPLRTVKKKS